MSSDKALRTNRQDSWRVKSPDEWRKKAIQAHKEFVTEYSAAMTATANSATDSRSKQANALTAWERRRTAIQQWANSGADTVGQYRQVHSMPSDK